MPEFLFDRDPVTGATEYIRPDENGFTIRTVYPDAKPALDFNQAIKNERGGRLGSGVDGSLHHVASIPPALWHEWYQKYGQALYNDPQLVIRLIKDRDFMKVQTSEKI